jgi:endo-1,4-beta-D-glucanase Y
VNSCNKNGYSQTMWTRWAVLCGWFATGSFLALAIVAQAAVPWPLWEGYTSFSINDQGRVIDRQGGDRTTSEGQSYGLFFALVSNDRARFDLLLKWTTDNLAGGDLGIKLPGWLWGKSPAGEWQTLDQNSASDADLWIAYSLCEAGRLWRQPQYGILGRQMLARIAADEVVELPGFGTMLLPGGTGFHPTADTWLLNPSYLPLPLFARLAVIDPQGPWAGIAGNVPSLLAKSVRNGFAMDWVSYRATDGFQPASRPGNPAEPGGSYDAIRVYLWAGLTHPQTKGRAQTLDALHGMADYLATHGLPPEQINGTGVTLAGNAPVGFSAALLPYLQAKGAKSLVSAQKARVMAQFDPATKLFGKPPTYYDENLTLFGLGGNQHMFAFGRDGELQVTWSKQ